MMTQVPSAFPARWIPTFNDDVPLQFAHITIITEANNAAKKGASATEDLQNLTDSMIIEKLFVYL